MTTFKRFKIETPSGVTLDCAEQGDPDAAPVLLLHGYSDSWRSYGPLLAALSPGLRAIAVTLRGHGDSMRPEAGYGIADLAGDLPAVLDRCGVARAAVVGHSMGSMVAARLALAYPGRVRGLVLLGALATLKGNPAEAELRAAVDAMTNPVEAEFVRAFQESTLARPVPDGFLESVVAESLKLPARVWRAAFRAMVDDDLGPELGRLAAPTLILWGDCDGLCDRASQTRLVEAIPDARLATLPGAGHAPHWEQPQNVAAMIAAFLDETRQSAA